MKNPNPLARVDASQLKVFHYGGERLKSGALVNFPEEECSVVLVPVQEQGTLLILDKDGDTPSFNPSNYSLEFTCFSDKHTTMTLTKGLIFLQLK